VDDEAAGLAMAVALAARLKWNISGIADVILDNEVVEVRARTVDHEAVVVIWGEPERAASICRLEARGWKSDYMLAASLVGAQLSVQYARKFLERWEQHLGRNGAGW
jgi:hypothetical protein